MFFQDSVILIFAKAPISGSVKTRLIPHIGEKAAAATYRFLMYRLVNELATEKLANIEVWCLPDMEHPDFYHIRSILDCSLFNQVGDDLGQRMSHAVKNAFRRYQYVILIGIDCPELSKDYLKQAIFRLKKGSEVVIGPAEDGGYVLLGLSKTLPCLFDRLPWGNHRVLEMTRNCLRDNGWVWHELPEMWDVDRPEDLDRLDSYYTAKINF
jgi:rSAM/selenodomain-associated transferase 1